MRKNQSFERRDLPPLNALRAFEAVARLHSVTEAAGELHVTHGAVSRQLRSLEEALGHPVFERRGRGLALTDAGEQLHEATRAAFAPLRESWSRLRDEHAQAPFVLGCSGSLLARWVIPRLERLEHDLPALQLHLSAQEHAPDASMEGPHASLLLCARPWPPGWEVAELADERIGPVLSPRYAGWPGLRDRPASVLCDERLLNTQSRPQAWNDWAQACAIAPAKLHFGQTFSHLYYLLEAAIAGLGVAIAPEPLVADDLASGRLLAPWGFQASGAAWILATPRRRHPDRRSAALAQWLRHELAGQPRSGAPAAG